METEVNYFDACVTHFFNEAKTLTELFTSNLTFTSHLSGLGFDSIPVCYSLGSSVDDGSLEESFASCPQPCGKQWATFVHNQSIVIQENSVQYKEKYPVLFYTSAGSAPGMVNLWMSSRTHCLLLRNNYGLPLAEATMVQTDQHNSPKFHLSAKWLTTEIKKSLPQNLLLVNPLEDIEKCDPESGTGFSYKRDIGEVNEYLRSIYSVKIQPGFVVGEWPTEARDWLSRSRQWPDQPTVRKASEIEVRLVPHCGLHKATDRPPSAETAACAALMPEEILDCWMYDFGSVEEFLLQYAGQSKRQLLLLAQVLLYQLSDPNIAWHTVLKPAFFWYLEKRDKTADATDTLLELKSFLTSIKTYIDGNFLPDYFVAEMNVLDTLPHDEVEEMSDTLKAVLEMNDEEHQVLLSSYLQQKTRNTNSMTKLCSHLQQSFDRLVGVLYLQLYHRLHAKSNMDDSITLHREMIQFLAQSSLRKEIISPLNDLVEISMGSMLMVKAGHPAPNKEKRFFANQGQEYLKKAVEIDDLAGMVTLAGYYYFKKEFNKVADLLQCITTLAINSDFDTPAQSPSAEEFPSFLWSKWTSRSYMFDVLYSQHEKPFAPDHLSGSFGLMEGQVLGYVPYPVAIASTRFVAAYLYTQSLIKLGQGSKVRKGDLLKLMETEAEQEQDDMNEKRSVVYLNLLAQVYFELDDRPTGVGMLRKSMTILSNPRNPARWKLFALKTQRFRKYLTWGTVFVVGSAITAAAVRCVKPSLT